MFKKYFNSVYFLLLAMWRKLVYFIIPNIFTKVSYSYESMPAFQQLTVFTGGGTIKIGRRCSFGLKLGGFWRRGCIELQPRDKNAKIIFGDNIITNNNLCICAMNKITIGSDTLIGPNVTIMDAEGHGKHPSKRREPGEIGEVLIGENVWIGSNVMILKNSFIGKNSIIAAGAVVSGRFPDNVVIGGIPAKIIKSVDAE